MFEAPPSSRIGEVWFIGGGESCRCSPNTSSPASGCRSRSIPTTRKRASAASPRARANAGTFSTPSLARRWGLASSAKSTRTSLRAAALDGSIEQLMDWRAVRAGDFVFVPAGTIHAIGAGISLLEFQQNSDVTYRLYDYGRPRDLHLDEGLRVATRARFADGCCSISVRPRKRTLVDDAHFSVALSRERHFPGPPPLGHAAGRQAGDGRRLPAGGARRGGRNDGRRAAADRGYARAVIASAIAPSGPASSPSAGARR